MSSHEVSESLCQAIAFSLDDKVVHNAEWIPRWISRTFFLWTIGHSDQSFFLSPFSKSQDVSNHPSSHCCRLIPVPVIHTGMLWLNECILDCAFFFLLVGPTIGWFRSSLNVLEVGWIVDWLFDLPEGGRHLGHASHIEHVQGRVVENVTVSKSVRDPASSFIVILFLKLKFFPAHCTVHSRYPISYYFHIQLPVIVLKTVHKISSCVFKLTRGYPSEEYGTYSFRKNCLTKNIQYFSFNSFKILPS